MASIVYTNARKLFANKELGWATDTGIKIMLLSSAYTPNEDHVFISDLGAVEVVGAGYVGAFNGSGRKSFAA